MGSVVLFSALVAAAVATRARPDAHKRWIAIATIELTAASAWGGSMLVASQLVRVVTVDTDARPASAGHVGSPFHGARLALSQERTVRAAARGRFAMRGFVLGLLTAAGLAAAVVLLVFGTGTYSIAASRPPDVLDSFGDWAKRRSVPEHAAARQRTSTGDPAAIAAGLEHYATNCLPCHSVPGIEGMEFHEGMLPEPPHIDAPQVQRWSDGELFWIVKHGIRMTGMPAFGENHSDEEIAQIVAFVRHAPQVTETERQALAQALPAEHHHDGAGAHGEGTGGDPGHSHDDGHSHGGTPHRH
jgi:mono/diheme cytochrome c family protein